MIGFVYALRFGSAKLVKLIIRFVTLASNEYIRIRTGASDVTGCVRDEVFEEHSIEIEPYINYRINHGRDIGYSP